MKTTDISKLTDVELKSLGFDIVTTLNNAQRNLQLIEQELNKRQVNLEEEK